MNGQSLARREFRSTRCSGCVRRQRSSACHLTRLKSLSTCRTRARRRRATLIQAVQVRRLAGDQRTVKRKHRDIDRGLPSRPAVTRADSSIERARVMVRAGTRRKATWRHRHLQPKSIVGNFRTARLKMEQRQACHAFILISGLQCQPHSRSMTSA